MRLLRVIVDDLSNNTYFGMLELQRPGGREVVRVDSRPSDALALAVRTGARIYVAPPVLEAAADIGFTGLEDEVVSAIGITVSPVSDELREALELPADPGLLVTQVLGPAQRAGLAPGALLLSVDGETPTSPMQFLELIHASEGETVHLRYWQEGEEHTLELSTDVPDLDPPGSGAPPGLQRS